MDIYLFGAGASAAEGAPATQDFFAKAWQFLGPSFDGRVQAVWHFLEAVFHVPVTGLEAFACIPAVDEVVSLIDWSLHVNQGLGPHYDPPRLYQVRRDVELLLCATLDAALASRPQGEGPHTRFVRALVQSPKSADSALLSLNYDTLLDDALADAGLNPDYGFRDLDLDRRNGPLLLKLHGSLNWARCPSCDHIEVASGKVAHLLPHLEGLSCSRCGNDRLHGVIISPTWLKSYHGCQLQHVWDLAFECMQHAERLVFVGYSMPAADVAIYQLIRRGLLASKQMEWPRIEVINHHEPGVAREERRLREEAVVARFTRLFGRGARFDFSGFRGQI